MSLMDRYQIWTANASKGGMADVHECAVKVLPKYFKEDFAKLACNLPPSSDFWSVMEEEIDVRASNLIAKPENSKAFVDFLSIFFTPEVVEDVEAKFAVLSHSFLGLEYTLRKGHAEFAKSILADLHELPSFVSFFGWISLESESVLLEPHFVSATHVSEGGSSHVPPDASGKEDEGGSTSRGGRDDDHSARDRYKEFDAQGGGDGEDEPIEIGDQFLALEQHVTIIQMSPFNTPPKGDYSRSPTLKARSQEFMNCCISGDLFNMKRIYDPGYSTKGRAFFYHGTCTSSLSAFKVDGISPKLKRNEFSVGPTFYVSNSLRHAYEHPLHKHVSQSVDPVSVLVFELDIAVLHGEKNPAGEASPLKVKWFPCHNPMEEKKWSEFCSKNMDNKIPPHDYDMVIGPICIKRGDEYVKQYGEIPGRAPLTQVAFCSARARSWLQKCFKHLYKEVRANSLEAPI